MKAIDVSDTKSEQDESPVKRIAFVSIMKTVKSFRHKIEHNVSKL